MIKNLTLFMGLLLTGMLQFAAVQSANAQGGTENDNFLLQMNTSTGSQTWGKGTCGWNYSLFGASVTEDLCAEIVWAYDGTGNDSLLCDPVTMDLTGKIALIRRGVCGFSLKAYRAQQAGAIAVVIINHYANAAEDGCYVTGMSGLDSAAAVVIPAIFVCRDVGEVLDAAIKAGTTEACFSLPRMYEPYTAYHYATPAEQVDSFTNIAVRYVNRSGFDQTNVVVKVDIREPGTTITSLVMPIDVVAADQDTLVMMPGYLATAGIGKYDAVFSNNKYTEPRDTVIGSFEVTEFTYATDNLVIDPLGVGPSNQQFIDANFFIQSGGLCTTNDNPAVATYVTFGLSNVDSVWVPEPGANVIGITIYNADADSDGVFDLNTSWDDLAAGQIGFGSYEFTGNEGVDSLFSVPVTDFNGNPLNLDANGAYYVSLFYDGNLAGTGRAVRFSNTTDVNYFDYVGLLSTPLYLGSMFSGWSGAMVIQRLELEGFNPGSSVKPNLLADAKISVSPNPAVDQVRVDLNLDQEGQNVAVSLLDFTGQSVRTQVVKNFTNGTQITLNASDLPSGSYVVWVRTAEGSTMKKIMICH
ncbi:MAG: T9SS type A sorting domain-containing protein [Saprospiraceae bacterium]|nr:T9SS type A sorting domain-containing protein [Saprospiraceae bacterium]